MVGEGESVRYLAEEKSSDPKVVGIVASGYPTRSLSELGLENKYQGFYATKMALWSYLISDWDINRLTVNPNLSGAEAERAKKILAAARDIYAQGTAWNDMKSPEVTCTPDR
ncbi:Cys-Gln thioester bond-forming surface protein, partial [Pseudoflavonifractor phocaeensis]|nr:Cys-Gln thioester bond-forming surface protein [Pseudoflavonifractor phocaeensis]